MPGVMAAAAVVCVKRALPAVCMLGLVSVPHRHRNPRWPLADCPQELGLAQISGWQGAGYLVGGSGSPRRDPDPPVPDIWFLVPGPAGYLATMPDI